MATATHHATMLAEITAARDEHRSGALDVEWDGARASVYFVFGQPCHATFESFDGRDLAGTAALSALVDELPLDFRVAPWRRIMVTEDTLRCTVNDMLVLFGGAEEQPFTVTLPAANGHAANGAESGAGAATAPPPPPVADARAVPFGMRDFPLLPLGPSLWSDAAANVVHLEVLVSRLPNSLIVLTGPTRRAAALIADGAIVDAVWVDEDTGLLGEEAAHALMNVGDGMVSGYRIDDIRLVNAIPLLWRGSRLSGALPARWLDAEDIVAEVRSGSRSCALLVDGEEPGAALFTDGELVAVYTAQRRRPATTTTALRSLLHAPGARVTVVGCADGEERGLELNDESFHLFIAREDAPAAVAPVDEPALPAITDAAADVEVDVAPVNAEPPPDGDEPAAELTDAQEQAAPSEPASADPHAEAEPADQADDLADAAGVAVFTLDGEPGAVVAGADAPVEPEAPVAAEPPPPPAEPLHADAPSDPSDPAPSQLQPAEFVPARLDIDIDALRTELIEIAAVWLGADDAAPVAAAIAAARPGVDDFVSAIASIAAMTVTGHEHAVVRAMAREMHFRAAEVLCGV